MKKYEKFSKIKPFKKLALGGVEAGTIAAGMIAPVIGNQDEVVGGAFEGVVSGATAGSTFGPIGTGIGAVAGGIYGGITSNNAKQARLKLEQDTKNANNQQSIALATQRGLQTPVNGNATYSLTERKDGGKLSLLKYPDEGKPSIESKVNTWLGSPKNKVDSENFASNEDGEENDSYRHASTGRHTAEAITNKTGNIPIISKGLGFLGANALGIAHEIASPNFGGKESKDKYTPWETVREGLEDSYNNMVGAYIGSTPKSDEEKTKILENLARNNKLPDGYGNVFKMSGGLSKDAYFKKEDCGEINDKTMKLGKVTGGKLGRLSSNTIVAEGATHEQGGIKIPSMGVEVENKETLKKLKDGGTYVFSDTLVNPSTGNTFAKDDTKISLLKGRIENSKDNRFKSAALSLIKNREQKLVDTHEQVREQEGLQSADNTQVARKGGIINPTSIGANDMFIAKYPDGGKPDWNVNNPNYPIDSTGERTIDVQNRYRELNPSYDAVLDYQKKNGLIRSPQQVENAKKAGVLKYSGLQDNPSKIPISDPVITSQFQDNPDVDGIDGVSPSKFKFDSSKLSSLIPYIDNFTGMLANNQRKDTPIPVRSNISYLNPQHVDYTQSMKEVRDNTRSFQRGIDTTNADSGNANLMKAFGLGQQNSAIAGITQDEKNANVAIDNDFAGRNKQIEQTNNEINFTNNQREVLAADDIRREGQQNVVNTSQKFQQDIRDNNYMNYLKDQQDTDIAGLDERGIKVFNDRQVNRRKGGKLGKIGKMGKMVC